MVLTLRFHSLLFTGGLAGHFGTITALAWAELSSETVPKNWAFKNWKSAGNLNIFVIVFSAPFEYQIGFASVGHGRSGPRRPIRNSLKNIVKMKRVKIENWVKADKIWIFRVMKFGFKLQSIIDWKISWKWHLHILTSCNFARKKSNPAEFWLTSLGH